MPLGLSSKSKKNGVDEEKSMKSSLFGGRSKSKTPAPDANPYASQDSNTSRSTNPYAAHSAGSDPYSTSQSSRPQPPTGSFGNLSLNGGNGNPPPYAQPASPAPNRYEKSPAVNSGQQRYPGQAGPSYIAGYGNDPYGGRTQPQTTGYGGFQRTKSSDTMSTDAGRSALFGSAAQKSDSQAKSTSGLPPQSQDESYSNSANYASDDMPGGYGTERALTEQEQEDQDVNATKDTIRDVKKQTLNSSNNARRIAEESTMLGADILARINEQGTRMYKAEEHLDSAANQNILARQKAGELKTLNRSMFAVHVDNPFTAKKREQAMMDLASQKRRDEREMHGATRADQYQAQAQQQEQERQVRDAAPAASSRPQRDYAARSKYQFEANSSDDETEDQIEDNLQAIGNAASQIHRIANVMNSELDRQNEHIARVAKKTDKVDDQIARNRALLDKFH